MALYKERDDYAAKCRPSASDAAHHRRITSQAPLTPLVSRAELVVADQTENDLATVRRTQTLGARQLAARAFAAEVEEGRASYGGMLGRVWKETQRTLAEVERDEDMPIAKRVAALRDLAKLMPMLAKAEAIHVARIGGVAVEDMSDAQLERELRHIKKKRNKKGQD